MALRRVADALGALVEHVLQHHALVVGRAADQEVARRRSPGARQPLDVGLEAARGEHHRAAGDAVGSTADLDLDRLEAAVRDRDVLDLRVVEDADPEILCSDVVGVHQRLAAAEKERVGAAERKRPRERRLKAHAVCLHPGQARLGRADGKAGEVLVGLSLGHQQEVVEVFVLLVAVDQDRKRAAVHAAEVAGVARVAAPVGLGRAFQDHDPAPGFGRLDRRAERRVAAAHHHHVPESARHLPSVEDRLHPRLGSHRSP